MKYSVSAMYNIHGIHSTRIMKGMFKTQSDEMSVQLA